MTTAQQLNGKRLDEYKGPFHFNTNEYVWTFPDGSRATCISLVEQVEPYVEMGVTKSFKTVKYWKAI